jgi:hypothetical protein
MSSAEASMAMAPPVQSQTLPSSPETRNSMFHGHRSHQVQPPVDQLQVRTGSHDSADAHEQVGEVVAAWEFAPGSLILLGWQHGAMPARGDARLDVSNARSGPFRSVSWALAIDGQHANAHGFAVAVQLTTSVPTGVRHSMLLSPEGEPASQRVVARLPEHIHSHQLFGSQAVHLASGNALPLARFLASMLVQPTIIERPDVSAMMAGFLWGASVQDGCTEMVAAVPEACAVLQGWGRPDAALVDCLLVGTSVMRQQAQVATFEREDIPAPCLGSLLVMPVAAAEVLAQGAQLYLLAGSALRRRSFIEDCRWLGPDESVAHIADILPRLQAPQPTAERLAAATRPRFSGVDTLAACGHAIRAAVDLAVRIGGGAYLHGWLLDPTSCIVQVSLRSTAGASVRLDERWSRILRPDVSEAFRAEPGFAGIRENVGHGFAVHAPGMSARTGRIYLEIMLRDGSMAFMPLQEADAADPGLEARLLGSVDMFKPSCMDIIEHQLAPLLAGSGAQDELRTTRASGRDGGWKTAIVVALGGAPELPRAFLAQFLSDPLSKDEGFVFVCGPQWLDRHCAQLRDELDFRRLDAILVQTTGRADPVSALQLAAAHTQAPWLLSAGWRIHAFRPGWRQELQRVADAHPGNVAAVCATQIYEDHSIRFAGVQGVRARDHAPWFEAEYSLAGLPYGLVPDGPAVTVFAGSLNACLLPRRAVTDTSGPVSHFCTPEAMELDYFLRLRAAGHEPQWAPGARVYALDQDGPDTATQAGRLSDAWSLRHVWSTLQGPGTARTSGNSQ